VLVVVNGHEEAVAHWRAEAQRWQREARLLAAENKALLAKVAALSEKVATLAKLVFGTSSERKAPTAPEPAPDGVDKPKRRRGQQPGSKGHGRRDYSGLETVEEVHDVPEGERVCPCCGAAYEPFGEETSGQIDWQLLPATLDDDRLAGLSEDRSAWLRGDAQRRRRPGDWPWVAGAVGDRGQVLVSSAMAFLAQASSTRLLPSAAAAMRAAVAALFSARGCPLA
jgi:hypothetical protein